MTIQVVWRQMPFDIPDFDMVAVDRNRFLSFIRGALKSNVEAALL